MRKDAMNFLWRVLKKVLVYAFGRGVCVIVYFFIVASSNVGIFRKIWSNVVEICRVKLLPK